LRVAPASGRQKQPINQKQPVNRQNQRAQGPVTPLLNQMPAQQAQASHPRPQFQCQLAQAAHLTRHNVGMNIVILDDYQDVVRKLDCAAKLENFPAKVFTNTVKGIGQLSVRLKDADVIVLNRERTSLSRSLIEKLPRLKMVAQTGRVGDHIDLAACTERGVAVAEGVGSPTAPAELTWALIMAAARRLPHYISSLKHGAWQQSGLKSSAMPANFGLGTVLKGKTLGIWGYGKIGQLVAGYGKAFGMQVQVWGSDESRVKAVKDGYLAATSREAFFQSSDVISLHLRLNEATTGIVTSEDLGLMKPAALIVNTSRAELIEANALIGALNRGRPGMAAVDVFESEPILQGSALLRLENCICTPHIGYVEKDSYELYFGVAFDNVVNFIKGTPTNIVNPGALQVRR
jgi:D-3-phosphoglycerate dehydrogenase